MSNTLHAPIGILDEHPDWSRRLFAELEQRHLPFERIDHARHAFDPRDRARPYSVMKSNSPAVMRDDYSPSCPADWYGTGM